MTPEEIEATAQRTAALIAAPAESVELESVPCSCHTAPVTADAVARSDAPASLTPEDGMQPMPAWEAENVELKTRISALENRFAALESDLARMLVENTNILTLG